MSVLDGFRERARTTLAKEVWDYLEAGADDGLTAARAEQAWQELRLRPRILRGVAEADPAATILGQRVALPAMIAPNGRATRYHPDGERALLVGAAAAGAIVVLPSSVLPSLAALSEVVPDALVWQQLYMTAGRDVMRDRLRRAESAGCRAIVLTADLLPGGAPAPPVPPPAAWEISAPDEAASAVAAATFDDLAWLCGETGLPVVLKGVLRGDDAETCIAAGAAALIVSNHGGNQLDTAIGSAEALEDVVDACGGKAEVYVDGGIRRGTSVLKALALGATAVLVGRPASHALAAAGAQGVSDMLAALDAEMRRAMALCGAASIAHIDRSLVVGSPMNASGRLDSHRA